MFLINILEYLINFAPFTYIIGAFAFFSVMAAIQFLIFGKGVD